LEVDERDIVAIGSALVAVQADRGIAVGNRQDAGRFGLDRQGVDRPRGRTERQIVEPRHIDPDHDGVAACEGAAYLVEQAVPEGVARAALLGTAADIEKRFYHSGAAAPHPARRLSAT